jgi:hypothetical protein
MTLQLDVGGPNANVVPTLTAPAKLGHMAVAKL